MKKSMSTLFANTLVLIAIFCSVNVFADHGTGGEHFEVYLNDKLILQQGITPTFRASALPLDNLTASDKLVIHYRQCHGVVAKGRSVSIKDEKGKVLKEWKFADSDDTAMIISGNDILQLKKQYPKAEFKLCYTSTQFSENRTLAALEFKSDKTAFNN
jgi:hypothetical protein